MNLNHCFLEHIPFHFSKAFLGAVTVKGGIVGHILSRDCGMFLECK